MSEFITRVLLHDATHQQYDQLHTQMHAAGFASAIRGDDGNWHQMPWAEYVYSAANTSAAGVRDLAVRVVAAVVPRFEVFVTASNGWAAHGLQKIVRAA
jgi:hypothetical protein